MKSPLIALTVVSALAACIALLVVTPVAAAQDPTVRAAIESQIARVVEARKRSDPAPFLMILDTAFSITTLTGEPIDRRRYEAARQQNWGSVVSVEMFTITVDSLRTAQDQATVFTTQHFDRSDRAADGTLRDVSSTTTARETWVLVGSEWLLKHREDLEPSVTTVDGNPVPVDRAGRAFVRIFWEHGVDEARRALQEAKRRDPGAVLFEERTLNVLGYNLLERGRLADAIGVFELNVAAYPEAWNTYDSLGEAYAIAGHPDLAVTHYRRSLALNPDNQNAAEMLARLEVDTSPPDAAQLGIPPYPGAVYVPEFVEGLDYGRMEWQEEAAVYRTDDPLETVLGYFRAVSPDLPAPRHAGEAVVFEQLKAAQNWEIQTVPVGVLPASFLGDVSPQATTRLATGMVPIRASDVFVTMISPHPSPGKNGLASGTLIMVLRQRRPPTPPPLPTLEGPEATDLVARLNGYLAHAGDLGFEVLELPSGRASTIEGAGSPNSLLHDVVGPDPVGRVVYVEIPGQDRHVVKTMRMDGADDRVLVERPGDPMWGNAIGRLALSPDGERLAFVGQAEEMSIGEGESVPVGPLEVWDLRERTGGPVQLTVMWGLSLPGLGGTARNLEVLSWLPDGRRILYVELVPRAQLSPELATQAAVFAEGWERVPVIAVVDVVSMEKRRLRVGLSPLAGPGDRVLMEVEPGHYRLLDLATGQETSVAWPGDWRGPIAYLDDDLLIYRGLPTAGAAPRYTVNNSPMVGPKPMGDVKVIDLRTGRFQTISEGVDPRVRYVFMPRERGN